MKRAVLLLGLVACSGRDDSARPAPAASALISHTAKPDGGVPEDAAAKPRYVGVIAAAQLMDVAPLVQGVIANVRVRPGDQVKAGDVVVEMDPTSMQEELRAASAAVTAAQAAYSQASVDVQDAKRKLTLETKAVADGVSPRQNVEQERLGVKRAQAAAEHAAATVAAEQARRDTARDHVADTTLRAKFDGTVQLRLHDDGATVQAGQAIVRIVGQAGLRLRFAVPPDRAASLPLGTKVTATVDTVATAIPAVISQVSPALDPASGLVIVEAEMTPDPAAAAALRHGLAAWVQTP